MEEFSRTALLFGTQAMEKLAGCHVAIFGIGGVGGYVVEALARSGVGELTLVDNDTVSVTNINRQIIALQSTVGQPKVDVAKARVLDINPSCKVHAKQLFFLPETADQFDFKSYDYVVDAIDTVTGKLQLIEKAKEADVPIISCLGAGNKTDPTAFQVADIQKTSIDPLARVLRKELKKRGISHLKVVYSTEAPITPEGTDPAELEGTSRRALPGSNAWVPSAAGLILAGQLVEDLLGNPKLNRKAEN